MGFYAKGGREKTKPNKANLLAFSVLRKESQGLRSADSVKCGMTGLSAVCYGQGGHIR